MRMSLSHIALHFATVCLLITTGWCYRSSGQQYGQSYGQYTQPSNPQNQNTGSCPFRAIPATAVPVTDNIPYDCLPSYLRNRNAVLDDDDGTTVWAEGRKPDYSTIDQMFVNERTIIHPIGSMEDKISNLIKNWDKELRHKTNPQQWVTLVPQNYYMINNGERLELAQIAEMGSYNMFLARSEFYSRDYITRNDSDTTFHTALASGFVIEVLQVFSPPPRITFSFRHWGHMTGPLRCPMRNGTWLNVQPHGRQVEFFGVSTIEVNDKYQILNVENNFRGDSLMEQMVLGTVSGMRTGSLNNVNSGSRTGTVNVNSRPNGGGGGAGWLW